MAWWLLCRALMPRHSPEEARSSVGACHPPAPVLGHWLVVELNTAGEALRHGRRCPSSHDLVVSLREAVPSKTPAASSRCHGTKWPRAECRGRHWHQLQLGGQLGLEKGLGRVRTKDWKGSWRRMPI